MLHNTNCTGKYIFRNIQASANRSTGFKHDSRTAFLKIATCNHSYIIQTTLPNSKKTGNPRIQTSKHIYLFSASYQLVHVEKFCVQTLILPGHFHKNYWALLCQSGSTNRPPSFNPTSNAGLPPTKHNHNFIKKGNWLQSQTATFYSTIFVGCHACFVDASKRSQFRLHKYLFKKKTINSKQN